MITMTNIRSSMGTGWNVHLDGMFQISLSLLQIFAQTCVSPEGGGAVVMISLKSIVWAISLSCYMTV